MTIETKYLCLPYRQLGLELYPVRTTLPIYDAVTGQAVSEDADKLVERVRDALLDDARER